MANPYKGEVNLAINGKMYTIHFSWEAIIRAQDEVGEEALQQIFTFNLKTLAKIAAIGLASHHPEEANEEFVMKNSPIINDLRLAIDKALALAYFGKDGLPEEPEEEAGAAEEAPTKKKKTLWFWRKSPR